MNLFPVWVHRAAYITAAVLFLTAEVLALLSPQQGDTLTEMLRPVIRDSSLLAFLFTAVALWLLYHFLLET